MLRKPKASATVDPTNDPALPAAPQAALHQEQCKTCPKQLVSSRSKTLTIATHEVCKEHITACPVTYQPPKPEEEESDETEEAASREPAPVELSRKRKTSAVLESEKRAKLPKNSAARKELAATIAATATGARRHAKLASSPSTPTQTETIVIPSSPDSGVLLSPPNPQPRMPNLGCRLARKNPRPPRPPLQALPRSRLSRRRLLALTRRPSQSPTWTTPWHGWMRNQSTRWVGLSTLSN
ncbi:hypothetical protein BCR44DRAFT_250974 [Catenaria anguillulae PL171]|uniref:Uncharacterized protein n=1 Tax=Catenaria anguillulae PL171 TaxID=765915 RepID=A0A1Y2I2P4_9FUNG|nr:hypothetical protein BCR44DRAFT_250974 [Catenaria anguillulae PL171]